MDDFVLADSTRPNFSLPSLEMVDLTTPGWSLPDPTRPDPFLPDLTEPAVSAALARPDTLLPDPYTPDLLQPTLPAALTLASEHVPMEYGALTTTPTTATAPVVLASIPAQLAPEAQAMADSSADAHDLPPQLRYDQIYSTQDEMTHRTRHLAPLLLALDEQG